MTEALPCIVCGKVLRNEFPGQVANQPRDGVACFTSGNYGSTVYDSMDGSRLEFNICDEHLHQAGEQGRVHVGRTQRPVILEDRGLVGWEPVEYEPTLWHPDLARGYGEDSELFIDDKDLLAGLPADVHLNYTVAELLAMAPFDRELDADE